MNFLEKNWKLLTIFFLIFLFGSLGMIYLFYNPKRPGEKAVEFINEGAKLGEQAHQDAKDYDEAVADFVSSNSPNTTKGDCSPTVIYIDKDSLHREQIKELKEYWEKKSNLEKDLKNLAGDNSSEKNSKSSSSSSSSSNSSKKNNSSNFNFEGGNQNPYKKEEFSKNSGLCQGAELYTDEIKARQLESKKNGYSGGVCVTLPDGCKIFFKNEAEYAEFKKNGNTFEESRDSSKKN